MSIFLEKFKYKITENGCWECTSHKAKDKDGYSIVYVNGIGKNLKLHRLSFQIYKGAIPDGYVVMHKCDNPSCFNPDHLGVGTIKDNIHDMINKGRQSKEKHFRSLTESDILGIFHATGSQNDIADKYNVSRSMVSHIKRGKCWGEITGKAYEEFNFLDKETVLIIYNSKGTQREIAKKLGVAVSAVCDIKSKKRFKKYLSEV